MLLDTCGCDLNGTQQRWTLTNSKVDECDQCGVPLKNLDSVPVPLASRPALSILIPIVHPVEAARADHVHLLPEPLRTADRGKLYKAITDLADAIDPYSAHHTPLEPEKRLNGLQKACLVIAGWPRSIVSVPWHKDTPPIKASDLRRRLHKLSGKRVCVEDSPLPPATHQAPYRVLTSSTEIFLGLQEARETSKLSTAVLQGAVDAELIQKYVRGWGQSELLAFRREELVQFAQTWSARIKHGPLAYGLGISDYGVEQLVALGMLKAEGICFPNTGLFFSPANKAEFLEKIWSNRQSSVRDAVTLRSILPGIGGRPKPWGTIFAALLKTKSIPYSLHPSVSSPDHFASLPESIVVPQAAAAVIHKMDFDRNGSYPVEFANTLIQRDAYEWMNGTPKINPLLAHIKPAGTRPLQYRYADVDLLSQKCATVPELGYHHRLTPPEIFKLLRDHAVPELLPKGWCRKTLKDQGLLPE